MSALPPPTPTRPIAERINRAATVSDLLPLISEAGRLEDRDKAHCYADTILAKVVKLLAKKHPDGADAAEIARRWGAIDKRYYAPD